MPHAPPVFSSLRHRRSPLATAFFVPTSLTAAALLPILSLLSSSLPSPHLPFQRRNSRRLSRHVTLLSSLFSSLSPPPPLLPSSALTCFREFFILLHRAHILLTHCANSSSIDLLLNNQHLSGHFHDLNQEISTLLDVLPLNELLKHTSADVAEDIRLLCRRLRNCSLYVDPDDELLRVRVFSFLDEFERGQPPEAAALREAFVDRLGIRSAGECRVEIEKLEEMIYSQDEGSGSDCDQAVLGGVVALTRYCRFRLFGFDAEVRRDGKSKRRSLNLSGSGSISAPKDFCCPISLDLMRDPVIVATGQTYDRDSILQWMGDGHGTCPNSGQVLVHTRLVPNLAIRSLIMQWCAVQGVPYDPPDGTDASAECMAAASSGKAAVQANRAVAELLVKELADGSHDSKSIAARELRLLAKTGKENRACIADAGAIPLLQRLLSSSDAAAQENSVTAILNLSIHDCNKSRVMEADGCLRLIVDVLRSGWTVEARENAAATLFSLSAVHDYKKRIADELGAVEALAGMLRNGRFRGQKDAVTALFNLSTHSECCQTMVDSGAVSALVGALEVEGVAEDAAGALGLLVRRPVAAVAMAKEDSLVEGLIGLMRRGSPRGKENAVAALHEICRSGGATLTHKVARTPSLGGLIQTLLFSGTKRARRKAASLARMCQRSIVATSEASFAGGWGMEYALARSTSMSRNSSFVVGGSDVPVTVAISVPVL